METKIRRNMWHFIKMSERPALNRFESQYWLNIFKKIIKVGLEFEFNLQESQGTCRGDSTTCPCVYLDTRDCSNKCVHEDMCKDYKNIDTCLNKKEECTSDMCNECDTYSVDCKSQECMGFLSACVICTEHAKDCTNCNYKYDPEKNPSNIRNNLIKELKPTESYGDVKGLGIHKIIRDGSLTGDGGAEIITCGKRVDFFSFYNMIKKIMDSVKEKDGFMDERGSIHMHILNSYFGKIVKKKANGETVTLTDESVPPNISSLERPIPEIILANYHQLNRKYQNAMTWMFMGLDKPNKLTRWEKFRVSTLEVSAEKTLMDRVVRTIQEISSDNGGKNKYGWVNYVFCSFKDSNFLDRFHVEQRGLDGIMVPSVVAAIACMQQALLLKAIEISKYGTLSIDNNDWLNKAMNMKKSILNGRGSYGGDRFSDTSDLFRYEAEFRDEAIDLVDQLKVFLMDMGPAYDILSKLAEKPVALYRVEGLNWDDIEKVFYVEPPVVEVSEVEEYINQSIDTQQLKNCKDIEQWATSISKLMKEDKVDHELSEVLAYVEKSSIEGNMIWSDSLGTMLNI